MDEMMNYICSAMKATEKTLKKQAKTNRSFAFLAIAGIFYAVSVRQELMLHNDELAQLRNDIDELKSKGA